MKLFLISLLYFQTVSISVQVAETCLPSRCLISENCRCSNNNSPFPLDQTPQLISLTIAEAIVPNVFEQLWKPLLFNRINPDGNPISATFFVPHEYTDYADVQDLYLHGFEIGANSVTKNGSLAYWASATEETLRNEFGGQRQILSHFANIPIEDIIGAQAPQVLIEGDVLLRAYVDAGIQYDNTWTTRNEHPLYPYTLDYLSTQECRSDTICPRDSYPGFWILPMINILGNNSVECNAITNCNIYGTPYEIATWLLNEVQHIRVSSKAPLTLLIPSAFFDFIDNSSEAFNIFLDSVENLNDTFFVSQRQIFDWIRNPLPLDEFSSATPSRTAQCNRINCALSNVNGQIRYMTSCVPCPDVYPWLGNPFGLS